MKNLKTLCLLSLLFVSSAWGADLKALRNLFQENFDHFYRARYCGQNIAKFVSEANKRNIDLSNSYVLKVVGSGFLETSGFFTRQKPNDRVMLGYFHMIFVADGYVFDFDLYSSVVLKIEEYVRLQFTPPHTPFVVFGIDFNAKKELSSWNVTRFEWKNYILNKEIPVWQKKMGEFINLDRMLNLPRPY